MFAPTGPHVNENENKNDNNLKMKNPENFYWDHHQEKFV